MLPYETADPCSHLPYPELDLRTKSMRLTEKQSQGIVAAVILWAEKHWKANPRGG
jgi:hypothetical protein